MFGKRVLLAPLLLLVLPIVTAAPNIDISEAFSTVGEWLSALFQSEMSTFAVTAIVLTILIRSIFAASLKRVKIFEGSGGEGLGKFGNTISWTLSILAVIGLFYVKGDRDVGTFLENILGPAGIYAAIVIIIFLFFWLKGATGSTGWAVVLSGLIAMLISNNVDWPALASIGLLMVIVGFIMLAFKLAGWRKPASSGDARRTGNAERDLATTLRNVEQDVDIPGIDPYAAEQAEEDNTRREEEFTNHQIDLLREMEDAFSHTDIEKLRDLANQFSLVIRQEDDAIERRDATTVNRLLRQLKASVGKQKGDLSGLLKSIHSLKKRWEKVAEASPEVFDDLTKEFDELKKIIDHDHELIDFEKDLKRIGESWKDANLEIRKINKKIGDNLLKVAKGNHVMVRIALKSIKKSLSDKQEVYEDKEEAEKKYMEIAEAAIENRKDLVDYLHDAKNNIPKIRDAIKAAERKLPSNPSSS
jgi:hypothetical protein